MIKTILAWIGGIAVGGFAILVLVALVMPDTQKAATQEPGSVEAAPARTAVAEPQPKVDPRPDSQLRVLDAIETYRLEYQEQPNELKKSAVKRQRDDLIKAMLSERRAEEWIGVISEMNTTGDGHAYVTVRIGEDAYVKTYNNAFSDTDAKTLIRSDTPMYSTLAELEVGARIRFSGILGKEISLTEEGGMLEPEFLMRFSKIEPI